MRARVACRHCNAKRVKCDRPEGDGVCSRCKLLGVACELIESRRGKYRRSTLVNLHDDQLSPKEPSHTGNSASTSPATLHPSAGTQPRAAVRYVSPSITDLVFDRQSDPPNGRVVYMGDSSNMKYLVHEVGDPFEHADTSRLWGDNLQRSLMDRCSTTTLTMLEKMRSCDDQHISAIDAVKPLEPSLSDALLAVFFDMVFPFFPVFDAADLRANYIRGRISPLTLNAVYCVATIHCSDELVRQLGFDSRYLASSTFYQRAKLLYDTDYDTDGITNLQAAILLINWWSSPMQQKDTWYWLGVAANLAQALGMHRAKSYSILSDERRKLWRRIWWVLFIHDTHHAAVFGRPPHIHSQYCDVERLTREDLDGSTSSSHGPDESIEFLVDLCQLATLVDRCLLTKFSPTPTIQAVSAIYTELVTCSESFKCRSPQSADTLTVPQGFYPAILSLIHLDYLIVMHRMLSLSTHSTDLVEGSGPIKSAGMISRVLEDVLSSTPDIIARMPFVAFPAMFCSILIHIMSMRKDAGNVGVLSEHRANLAMVILDQLQDRWPLVVWTRHLLQVMLRDTKRAPLPSVGLGAADDQGRSLQANTAAAAAEGNGTTAPTGRSTPIQGHRTGSGELDERHALRGSSDINMQASASDGNRFNIATDADTSFSPMPFMFPLNDYLEDAGMEFWSLDHAYNGAP